MLMKHGVIITCILFINDLNLGLLHISLLYTLIILPWYVPQHCFYCPPLVVQYQALFCEYYHHIICTRLNYHGEEYSRNIGPPPVMWFISHEHMWIQIRRTWRPLWFNFSVLTLYGTSPRMEQSLRALSPESQLPRGRWRVMNRPVMGPSECIKTALCGLYGYSHINFQTHLGTVVKEFPVLKSKLTDFQFESISLDFMPCHC